MLFYPPQNKKAKYFLSITVDVSQTNAPHSKTFLAEGMETALSIASAFPEHQIIATLGKGKFASIDIASLSKDVMLCLDNDGQSVKRDVLIQKAVTRFNQHNLNVKTVMPDKVKSDYNDVLKKNGVQGMRNQIEPQIKREIKSKSWI